MEGGREGGEFSKSIQKWRGSYLSDIRVQKSQKLQNESLPLQLSTIVNVYLLKILSTLNN